MNTYSAQGNVDSRRGAIAWGERHQLVAAVTTAAAAVLVGLLIGILLSVPFSEAQTATLHRAGGHALATAAQAQHAAAASVVAATAVSGGEIASPSHIRGTRSPARGGFAVGRADGAGTGFIVIEPGTRAPARGGFAGRSIGAGD
jgi:hypothetical protein